MPAYLTVRRRFVANRDAFEVAVLHDAAADDTVFPPHWATRLGIDLASAPKGQAQVVGGSVIQVSFAPVSLLLSDGYETCQWDASVGFSAKPMRWALLGHSGFLEFFD